MFNASGVSEYGNVYSNNLPKKILLEEEEKEFLRKIKLGDSKAKKDFVEYNLKLVIDVAKRYSAKSKMDFDDLIQEGIFGLMKAVEKFNLQSGARFSTYAVPCIITEILNAINSKDNLIHIPKNLKYKMYKCTVKGDDNDSGIDLQKEMNSEWNYGNIQKAQLATSVVYFSATVTNSNSKKNIEIGDLIEDKGFKDFIDDIENKNVIDQLFKQTNLKQKEKEILILYFGLYGNPSHSLKDISLKYNLTSERIRQIKKKSLEKLRETALKNNDFLLEYY